MRTLQFGRQPRPVLLRRTDPRPSDCTSGRLSVRASTSPANTTAAAGAPPITEANEPSTAATSMLVVERLENTTNAPP